MTRPTPNWARSADARPDVVAFASGARRLLADAFPAVTLDEKKGPVTALVYYLGEVVEGRAPAYPNPCTATAVEAARAAEFWLSEIERKALQPQ